MQDKVVVITGATNGIGEVAATELARQGAKVTILGRSAERCAATARRIQEATGKQVDTLVADFSVKAEVERAARELRGRLTRLDVLVNNAGISGSVPDRMDLDYFDKQWEINARGTFLGMKLARDLLAKSGRGSIVNMSSVLGLIAHEITHMGYNASKGAVRLMSKAAAVQFADQGIRVNSVHPGWMSAMRTSVSSADPEQRKKLNAEVPLKRSGTAEEAAQAVLFLASDDSSYVTGSELVVDGGLSAR